MKRNHMISIAVSIVIAASAIFFVGNSYLSAKSSCESFNWNSWANNFVTEQPQDRKIQSINGKEVILVKGGSDPRATSQVYSKSGDILVNLVSKKYSEIDLSDIVKSINS